MNFFGEHLIIAGGRDFKDEVMLKKEAERFALDIINDNSLTVISGGAQGADTLGKLWAEYNGYCVKEILPNWDKYGKRAGIVRNTEMAKIGDYLLAFWDEESSGTAHMISEAKSRGIPYKVVNYPKPILKFDDEYRFLSNFYPCDVLYDGIIYPSAEHAYVAAKTHNIEIRYQIANGGYSAGKVKRLGRKLPLIDGWDDVKFTTMRNIVFNKFLQNDELSAKLLRTRNKWLEEGNHWGDNTWGTSPVGSHNGKNVLGRILMDVRRYLYAVQEV